MNFRLSSKADWHRLVEYVKTLPWQRDGRQIMYRVSIEELKPTRSNEANARWWALMTAISQQAPAHMGGQWFDPEVWHEHLVRRFAGVEAGPYGDSARKRTSKMRVSKFCDLMTEVEAWAIDEFPGFQFEREAA